MSAGNPECPECSGTGIIAHRDDAHGGNVWQSPCILCSSDEPTPEETARAARDIRERMVRRETVLA